MATPKIKLVSKSETDKTSVFNSLLDTLVKSGAVNKEKNSVVTVTSKNNSLVSDATLSKEDYLEVCKDLKGVPDGSHIDDEAERQKYLDEIKDTEEKIINKERIITIRGSDETVDRYGDIVRVQGWDLNNYRKNPVFLVFHDGHQFPAGRAVKVWKEASDPGAPNGKSLMFLIYFPEGNQWSEFVYNQFKDGLMNAVSVGFRALKANNPASDEERQSLGLGTYGVEFLKQELLELSAVPIPANQNALVVKSFEQKELAGRIKELEGVEIVTEEEAEKLRNNETGSTSNADVVKALKEFTEELKTAMASFSDAVKEFTESTKNLEINVKVIGDDLDEVDEAEEKEKSSKVYDGLMDLVKSINQSTEDK